MNPDPQDDWLDRALMSREAMQPGPGFTRAVMRRIAAQPLGAFSAFLAEEGVRLGVALATVGFLSIVDVDEVGNGLHHALQAPDATVVAAVALSVGWFVLSWRTDEAKKRTGSRNCAAPGSLLSVPGRAVRAMPVRRWAPRTCGRNLHIAGK